MSFLKKMLDFSARNVYNIIVAEKQRGSLAQLGERLPYKQRVGGSSPSTSTIFLERLQKRAQMAR